MALLKIRKTPTAQAITPISGVAGLSIDENNVPYIVTDTGDIIPIGESTLSQEILDALASAESPTGDNPFVTLAQLQSFIGTSTILLYGGSAQWSGTGLVFDGSPSGYLIENVLYEIDADTITADTADSTNDRRDTFKLTTSGWDIETGTPSAVPIAPTVNPITEIGLKDVLIEANATTPTIDTENVYLENSEWATSSSGAGTFNPASTSNPFAGSVAFESTNIQNGSRYIFTRASNIDLTNFDSIGLRINLKAPMNNGRNFGVQFLNDSGNAISTLFPLPISKSLDLAYQFVSLDLVDFLFSDRTAVRGLQIVYYGSGGAPTYAGAFVDNIILQSGFGVQPVFDGVESVTGDGVDNTDPKNPVIDLSNYYLKSEIDPLASTGSEIFFDRPRVYGSVASPITATTLTENVTSFRAVVQTIFHQAASFTPPAGWVLDSGSDDYDPAKINIIYVDAITSSYKRYTITSDE